MHDYNTALVFREIFDTFSHLLHETV